MGWSLILIAFAAQAETIAVRVVSVADGDTVTVTVLDESHTQHKIRLAGFDAPEKKQPFGERSKQHLSDLVFNKPVNVEWSKQDRYGCTVGKVMVNGVDANLEQIKSGMVWWYEKYRREQCGPVQDLYSAQKQDAKDRRLGFLIDSSPMPPWNWRKIDRKNALSKV